MKKKPSARRIRTQAIEQQFQKPAAQPPSQIEKLVYTMEFSVNMCVCAYAVNEMNFSIEYLGDDQDDL